MVCVISEIEPQLCQMLLTTLLQDWRYVELEDVVICQILLFVFKFKSKQIAF